jgi:hypothetical protein
MVVTQASQQRSNLLLYEVDPYEIHYLKFILEAYEGLATLTTLDPQKGIVQLAVPPEREGSVESLMQALGQEFELKKINSTQ